MQKNLACYLNSLKNKNTDEILQFALHEFGEQNLIIASSFGVEDQVLLDMAVKLNKNIRVFTLDTGRLFQETYVLMQKTMEKYKLKIELVFPEKKAVEDMVNQYGPNLFYSSVENRKLCCEIRKIRPLKNKLSAFKAWLTGLRKDQSGERGNTEVIEWDNNFSLYKINPLYTWTQQEIWAYAKKNKVPYNELHDRGFLSIGCAPCTRAVNEGENERSGRWWWEEGEKKECGLHTVKEPALKLTLKKGL